MDQEEKQFEYEDEIDLIDYVKVILKRKRLILAIFFIIVIVVGVFSWVSPKVYQIDTTLEIGKINKGEEAKEPLRVIETPDQVVEKINDGVYGWSQGIEVNNPTNTNLIKIEITSKDPKRTKKILDEINELILTEHNNKVDTQKNLLEKEIERLQEKINFLISKDQETAILQLEINNLQRQKEMLQLTKVIKEPTVSKEPFKPKPLLNIAIAGVLGIFIGIFWVFFKEWWEKNKEES